MQRLVTKQDLIDNPELIKKGVSVNTHWDFPDYNPLPITPRAIVNPISAPPEPAPVAKPWPEIKDGVVVEKIEDNIPEITEETKTGAIPTTSKKATPKIKAKK